MTFNLEIAVIKWQDAAAMEAFEWFAPNEEGIKLIPMTTVGLIVKENETLIAIATEFCHGREVTPFRGVYCIPKVNIVSVDRFPITEEDYPEFQGQS